MHFFNTSNILKTVQKSFSMRNIFLLSGSWLFHQKPTRFSPTGPLGRLGPVVKVSVWWRRRSGMSPLPMSFSKHRPSGPMLSISQLVHMFVCLSVSSLFEVRLNVFLPPLPKVRCPKIFGDSEWNGKKWS